MFPWAVASARTSSSAGSAKGEWRGLPRPYLRLDRRVALKCLLASSEGREDLRDRIVREARAAARITHSHVAAVHDVVEHEGRAFIVMEDVEGDSLAALIKQEALPAARVIAIGRQLAAALAAAHAGGVIHRDLKPANIQVMPDGSAQDPRLRDCDRAGDARHDDEDGRVRSAG